MASPSNARGPQLRQGRSQSQYQLRRGGHRPSRRPGGALQRPRHRIAPPPARTTQCPRSTLSRGRRHDPCIGARSSPASATPEPAPHARYSRARRPTWFDDPGAPDSQRPAVPRRADLREARCTDLYWRRLRKRRGLAHGVARAGSREPAPARASRHDRFGRGAGGRPCDRVGDIPSVRRRTLGPPSPKAADTVCIGKRVGVHTAEWGPLTASGKAQRTSGSSRRGNRQLRRHFPGWRLLRGATDGGGSSGLPNRIRCS